MRQRLGIAAALIGDPSVLILDEPANGLDPAGIRWMRDLLRDYADHGGTVLLSSHLLSEVEIVADDIVMIGQGRIVCQGAKAELLAAGGTVVRAADAVALQRALTTAGITTTVADDGSLRAETDPAEVGRAAYDGGVVLTELRAADSGGLEEMFLALTADTQRDNQREGTAA
jgi:ABC-2 type transport system ATP-binding protein